MLDGKSLIFRTIFEGQTNFVDYSSTSRRRCYSSRSVSRYLIIACPMKATGKPVMRASNLAWSAWKLETVHIFHVWRWLGGPHSSLYTVAFASTLWASNLPPLILHPSTHPSFSISLFILHHISHQAMTLSPGPILLSVIDCIRSSAITRPAVFFQIKSLLCRYLISRDLVCNSFPLPLLSRRLLSIRSCSTSRLKLSR